MKYEAYLSNINKYVKMVITIQENALLFYFKKTNF